MTDPVLEIIRRLGAALLVAEDRADQAEKRVAELEQQLHEASSLSNGHRADITA